VPSGVIAANGPLRWWAQGDAAQSCRKAAYSMLRWPEVFCTTQELAWRITASTLASLWAGSRGQPSKHWGWHLLDTRACNYRA